MQLVQEGQFDDSLGTIGQFILQEYKFHILPWFRILFILFELEILKTTYIAPSQLYLNSWTFIKGFKILCKRLEIKHIVGLYFSFYGTNGVENGDWVSTSALAKRARLTP